MNDTTPDAAEFPPRVIDRGYSQARSLFIGSAIDDAGLDPYEFRVYAHLKRRAQDGTVWAKQENMATICGMSRKTINEVLKRLAAKGWIQQERRTYKGHRSSNLISLLEPPCNPQLHSQVTQGYTAKSPTVTAKGTPLQGSPNQGKEHVISPDGEACAEEQNSRQEQQNPQPTPGKDRNRDKATSEVKAASSENVPGAAAALLAVWNEHRGTLPRADALTDARAKALRGISKAFGEDAPALLADAAREVALDPFWKERRYGLDNLLSKVAAKAEAYRARQDKAAASPLARRRYE